MQRLKKSRSTKSDGDKAQRWKDESLRRCVLSLADAVDFASGRGGGRSRSSATAPTDNDSQMQKTKSDGDKAQRWKD